MTDIGNQQATSSYTTERLLKANITPVIKGLD